jgi:hypothetical protein
MRRRTRATRRPKSSGYSAEGMARRYDWRAADVWLLTTPSQAARRARARPSRPGRTCVVGGASPHERRARASRTRLSRISPDPGIGCLQPRCKQSGKAAVRDEPEPRLQLRKRGGLAIGVDEIPVPRGNPEVSAVASTLVLGGGGGANLRRIDGCDTAGSDDRRERRQRRQRQAHPDWHYTRHGSGVGSVSGR